MPSDEDVSFKELPAAAECTRDNSGPFVDTEGAAEILGVTPQHVGRLAAQGRLPWLPTGRSGGPPTRAPVRLSCFRVRGAQRVSD
jgi:hypothetical protein